MVTRRHLLTWLATLPALVLLPWKARAMERSILVTLSEPVSHILIGVDVSADGVCAVYGRSPMEAPMEHLRARNEYHRKLLRAFHSR